ncbi:succinylglutamate desuccinylase/aspartoacylase family protein [Azospirillum halopraeferens]|uniref:succinylglutamate desuccinylase/aspartoacylase family protein n=1 Tax=Azospirillum halopraeferens TaxID=34010 RepID=UPI0003FFC645|nr:succinylglutamate desuccinylase/aspartoacylase family protein [Azospirillum halopraeferens]
MAHRVEELALAGTRTGTRRYLTVHRFGTPGARPKAYVQAGLHADEIPGMLVAHHLIGALAAADAAGTLRGEVVVVPVANPGGLAQVVAGVPVGRYALDRDGNFNRGFADLADAAEAGVRGRLGSDAESNVALIREALRAAHAGRTPRGDATEVETQRHALLGLALDADLVFDLHCDMEAVVHLYTGDALWPDAADLAAELGAEAVLLARDSGGGPFDEACSSPWWTLAERLADEGPVPPACLAATVELRGKADVDDPIAAADAAALMRVLMRRGVVAGDPGPLPALRCAATPLGGLDRVLAPAAGVVSLRKRPGDRVAAGEAVADIIDPAATDPARARTTLVARTAGILMARTNLRFAGPGDLIASIAGAEVLDARGHGLLFD